MSSSGDAADEPVDRINVAQDGLKVVQSAHDVGDHDRFGSPITSHGGRAKTTLAKCALRSMADVASDTRSHQSA